MGDYPESFRCPLSRSLMRDPVTAADGHSYERPNIEEWFAKRPGSGLTSPVTGLRLTSRALVPNITLRKSMQEFFVQQKKQHRAWKNGGGGAGGGGVEKASKAGPSGLWNIPEERLELGELIDKGSFGEVRRGVLVGDDGEKIPVAVKLLLVQTQAEERDMFEKELQVLHRAAMRCQHACRLYGTCVKGGKLALVMKLYAQSLDRLMRKQPQRRFAPPDAVRYSLEMARAIAELHACAIIIQDLKPPNILLDEFENIVVADFGLSAVIEGTRLGTRTVKGTFNYMAPEAFDPIGHGGLTVKADCWSWACCVIELFSGRPPWENDRMAVIMQKVLVGKRVPEIPREVPPQLADVLRRCFAPKANSRPSFMEMLPVLQAVHSGANAGGAAAMSAPAAQLRGLQMNPAKTAVNPAAVDRARQAEPGRQQGRYEGKNVGQWVEERKRDRNAYTGGRGPARGADRKPEQQHQQEEGDTAAPLKLPQDWIEYKDPKTGRPYYYNKLTKKTVWQLPRELEQPRTDAAPRLQPARAGGAGARLQPAAERRVGWAAEEVAATAQQQDSSGARLNLSKAHAAFPAVGGGGGRLFNARPGAAAPGEVSRGGSDPLKTAQLARTAQRMAAMLATSSGESSMRSNGSSSGPGSSTTEEHSSSSSAPRSATSVSELKGETRKCQSLLRGVENEMQRLRDAKTEAVRTGYAFLLLSLDPINRFRPC